MKRNIIFVSLFLMVALYGCDKIPGFKPKAKPSSQSQEKKEEVKINGPLLAKVGSWAIGIDDFKNYLENLKPLLEGQGIDVNNYDFKRNLLQDLVRNQILAQIAKDKGMDKDEELVKIFNDQKNSLLATKMRDDLSKNIDVSSMEVSNFYEQNKNLLRRPQEVKVREIVTRTEQDAKDAYIKILQGENFASLASQYSSGESAKNGGDLGYITYDETKKFRKFWETVYSLDKGATSSIFKGEDGKFYIVYIEDIRGGQEIPLSEVEKDLRERLKADKLEAEVKKQVDSYKAKAKIEINEDLIR